MYLKAFFEAGGGITAFEVFYSVMISASLLVRMMIDESFLVF
jgi:hypothetical protein